MIRTRRCLGWLGRHNLDRRSLHSRRASAASIGPSPDIQITGVDDAAVIAVGAEIGHRSQRSLPHKEIVPIGDVVSIVVARGMTDVANAKNAGAGCRRSVRSRVLVAWRHAVTIPYHTGTTLCRRDHTIPCMHADLQLYSVYSTTMDVYARYRTENVERRRRAL